MSQADNRPHTIPSAAACAEAAAWIARLHGEDRTSNVEAGFRRWLAASTEHREAFEMANEIWLRAERLPKSPSQDELRPSRRSFATPVPWALAATVCCAVLVIGIAVRSFDSGLATRVGEQRTLTLEDGSRISLNTASRVHVRYDRAARRVELDQGEAYFEVAKHPQWPFIVTAADRQVVARGTAFLVRRDDASVSVTLVEGKVTVAPAAGSTLERAAAHESSSANDFTLVPGERLTFPEHQSPRVDRPALERVTAWQRGQVILDHTPLADAVAEMNRYSDEELKLQEPTAGRAQVTGIFRVGDSQSFAQAVAETYGLRVAMHGSQIVLYGLPQGSGGASNEK